MVDVVKGETKYKCGICHKEYDTMEGAQACEKKVPKNIPIENGRNSFNDWGIGTVFFGGGDQFKQEVLKVVGIHQSSHAHTQYPECKRIDGNGILLWCGAQGHRLTSKEIAALREFADLAERGI